MADEGVHVEPKVAVEASAPVATEPATAQHAVSETDVDEKTWTADSSVDGRDEPEPRLHAKTWLTVFAVCLIYFAQLINVVGAGAVSFTS